MEDLQEAKQQIAALVKRKPAKTLQDKAIRVIEALVSEGLPFDLEFDVAMGREKDPKLIELNDILCSIYRFVHVAQNPCCMASHDDWIQELNKTYKSMKRHHRV